MAVWFDYCCVPVINAGVILLIASLTKGSGGVGGWGGVFASLGDCYVGTSYLPVYS
jgi:hypothetical protein